MKTNPSQNLNDIASLLQASNVAVDESDDILFPEFLSSQPQNLFLAGGMKFHSVVSS